MRPPYLASLAYYRAVAAGEEPVVTALNRARLRGDLLLTIPVAGGSGALKRLPPDELEISQHGRWQHTHLGALEAVLGNTPFWRHLEPEVVPLIEGAEGRLLDLNRSLVGVLSDFLDLPALLPELREFAARNPARLRELAEYHLRNVDEEAPMLVRAAGYGRDAIFGLVPALIRE